jgi:hypothetical protein
MTMRHLVFGFLALVTCSYAQSSIVVPAAAAARDGTANSEAAGFTERRRQQFLIGPSLLGPMRGRAIQRLTFRRDGAQPPLVGGQTRLTVQLSVAPFGTIDASSVRFADNHGGSPQPSFDATLVLPDAPRLPHRHAATWAAPHVVSIPLAPAFRYEGGVLCIELRGEPVDGSRSTWWPIDCETDGVQGSRTVVGTGCGRVAAQASNTASVAERGLRPSATAELLHLTDASAVTVVGLSALPLATPIELAMLGAPGCWLQILPDVTVPVAVRGNHLGRGIGSARCALRIPNAPASLGASFYAQWFDATAQGLAVSNGLRLDIAGTPTAIDAAMLISPPTSGVWPESGRLDVRVMPVLEFGLQ